MSTFTDAMTIFVYASQAVVCARQAVVCARQAVVCARQAVVWREQRLTHTQIAAIIHHSQTSGQFLLQSLITIVYYNILLRKVVKVTSTYQPI